MEGHRMVNQGAAGGGGGEICFPEFRYKHSR